MYLKALHIRNFRNILDGTISFHPKINLILGENAQGKTALLEAIYLLGTGKSFRANTLQELVNFNKSYFLIEAEIEKYGVLEHIRIFYDAKSKKIQHNSTQYSSFSQLFGLLPIVVMSPYDITLISSFPSFRRKFLNLQIAQHDPLYVHHLTRYWRAMRQRNAMLKAKRFESIEIFENQMVLSGQYLIKKRKKKLEDLEQGISYFLKKLNFNENESVCIKYMPSVESHRFSQNLVVNRNKEGLSGFTFQGPHRDDFSILLNQKKAKSFASEGQKRMILSSLKFSEWKLLSEQASYTPIMGIDDFAVHLDPKKQELLENSLNDFNQVFITSPVVQTSFDQSKTFLMKEGKITNLVNV